MKQLLFKKVNINGRCIHIYKDQRKKEEHKNVNKLFKQIPLSNVVMAYTKRSLYESAIAHKDSTSFLHMDIKKFFDNITLEHLPLCLSNFETDYTKELVAKYYEETISEYTGGLAQGSVLAPSLSNLVFAKFDEIISNYCERNDVIYTRYSDDMYFSTKDYYLTNVEKFVTKLLNDYNFKIKEEKTYYTHKGKQNHVKILGFNIVFGKNSNYITIGRKNRPKRLPYMVSAHEKAGVKI